MKTDVAPRNQEQTEKCDLKLTADQRVTRSGGRRTLQPLQKAAGDKENLVGGGRSLNSPMPSNTRTQPSTPHSATNKLKGLTILVGEGKGIKKAKTVKHTDKKSAVTVEDLTSEDGPSEGYWERVAERRREALEIALNENERLAERVKLLEEENKQCKALLEETTALVEALTGVLSEESQAAEEE